MGNIFRYIVLAGAMLCMLQACKKQSLETTYSSQEERIDSFIESLASQEPAPRIVHNAGSIFVVLIAALLYDRKFIKKAEKL